MAEYKVWFGRVRDCEVVERSDNLFESFSNCKNPKIPFSVKDAGLKVFKSEKEYYNTLRKVSIAVAEKKVDEELRSDEKYLIALLKTLDELDLTINLLSEKLRDLEDVRDTIICDELKELIKSTKQLRKKVEDEINSNSRKLIPNMSEILGGVIAVRLIERGGGLKRIAELPASTIQILGAEKSLFKALSRIKKGRKAKTPKHGIIFQHPYIRTLPKSMRGKMARFMAGKLAIASRIDFFRGELNEDLVETVRLKYEELKKLKKG
ncbi:rRNA biogenesis protein Nop56/Nop58 [Archaeoglobus sulfaticallidus PM70-1]|uniref:rRNA biogenesis protein Nop56/Nop58 n=1 Tax=Archaeoglobus sulfaticallidus PM70-1 TaxID=387631 RepID=N0BDD6_9EURY|nr:rRNA biogenesis protein Nop56/Nop58 [Archaeoglobus sulfaticallidus]AGK60267.1 rRNA biogenesis protein Nop56/Nop58 [Archaeoglobus sulfaticallidus PM70-1]